MADQQAASGWRVGVLVAGGASVALLVGAVLGRWPYGYYTLLRLVVCGTALYFAWLAYEAKSPGWAILLGLAGLLFNPVLPFQMRRADWLLFDAAATFLMVAAVFRFARAVHRK